MMRDQSNQRAAMARLVLGTSRSWRRLVDQELAAHGFSQASALPLIVLLRSEHVRRQSEIADFLHLERPALVRIVDLLVAKGWVERVGDPVDRRAKILTLTKVGRTKALAIDKVLDALRQRVLAGLDDPALQAALAALQVMERNLIGLLAGEGTRE